MLCDEFDYLLHRVFAHDSSESVNRIKLSEVAYYPFVI